MNLLSRMATLALVVTITTATVAQSVSVYQFRHVPQENVSKFIQREVTFWQKVAQKAIDEGKMEFWGLFQKVGVYDAPNSSNFLFINIYENIDEAGGWDPSGVFPNVPVDAMETMSLGHVTSQVYVRPLEWVDGPNANPEEDYRYVVMNYFDPASPGDWLAMEREDFKPYITEAMKSEGFSQCAWGNARVLAPIGGGMNVATISMDVFSTLQEALMPNTESDVEAPVDKIMEQWNQLRTPYQRVIYRIVAVAN